MLCLLKDHRILFQSHGLNPLSSREGQIWGPRFCFPWGKEVFHKIPCLRLPLIIHIVVVGDGEKGTMNPGKQKREGHVRGETVPSCLKYLTEIVQRLRKTSNPTVHKDLSILSSGCQHPVRSVHRAECLHEDSTVKTPQS